MRKPLAFTFLIPALAALAVAALRSQQPAPSSSHQPSSTSTQPATHSPIVFELKDLPFRLDSDESQTARNAPETMAGGVAVFD